MTSDQTSYITMGIISGAVGLKGYIRVQAYTEEGDALLQYPLWHLSKKDGLTSIYKVEKGYLSPKGLQVKLEDIGDRTAAEELKGAIVSITRDQLLPLEDGEYYWYDLVDLKVYDLRSCCLGTVKSLMKTSANDVLVIKPLDEGADILIPFVDQYVKRVSLSDKRIEVDWWE